MATCPPLPIALPQYTEVASEVACKCRCGICCREMVIRASASDALREPRIALVGHPTAYCGDSPTEFLLNRIEAGSRDGIGPCLFLVLEPGQPAACAIHETRPDVCRRLDCDGLRSFAAEHLAKWKSQLAASQS